MRYSTKLYHLFYFLYLITTHDKMRIVFEPDLTEEQKLKAVASFIDEKHEKNEVLKKKYPQLWKEIRHGWLPQAREDILGQLKKSISGAGKHDAQ